jgi:hypothetical protein
MTDNEVVGLCPFKQMQRYPSIYCSYLPLIPELLYLPTPGRIAELERLLVEAKTDSSSRLKLAVFNATSAEVEGLLVTDPARAPGHLPVPNGIADVKQALQAYIATRKSYSHVAHTHAHTHTHAQLGPAERPAPSSCKEWMQLQVNQHGSAISAHSYDKSQMQKPTRSVLSLSLSLSLTHTHTHLAVANTS